MEGRNLSLIVLESHIQEMISQFYDQLITPFFSSLTSSLGVIRGHRGEGDERGWMGRDDDDHEEEEELILQLLLLLVLLSEPLLTDKPLATPPLPPVFPAVLLYIPRPALPPAPPYIV